MFFFKDNFVAQFFACVLSSSDVLIFMLAFPFVLPFSIFPYLEG